jgi:peptidoglycan/xylan/chitin deacetylase (PgdA/CDA1 family)
MTAADSHPVRKLVQRTGLRRSLAALRLKLERTVRSRRAVSTGARRSRILAYHSVGTAAWGVNDVSPEQFQAHLGAALQEGYRFAPAAEIAAGRAEEGSLAITFDDGLMSVAQNAAPILKEFGIPWSLFIVSDWATGRHEFEPGSMLGWREVEVLAGQGATIGSHSVTHPDFGRLDSDRAANELADSREAIARALGEAPVEFAIPFGQSRNWTEEAMSAARAAGYTTVYAQSEAKRPRGTVARTFITKFDTHSVFKAALGGAFDDWEEWV